MRLDMEFLFKCSTPFLTGEHSERVRYRVEHQQLIGDFQSRVKNYQSFSGLISPSTVYKSVTRIYRRCRCRWFCQVRCSFYCFHIKKDISSRQSASSEGFFSFPLLPLCMCFLSLKTTLKSFIKFVSLLGIFLSFCLEFSSFLLI